jgi:hypothetical protein
MSRQIQIRRGTAAENDNFTGAIGEVTMDTTNKTLRVHDGETLGGTVLAKQSEIPQIQNFFPNYSSGITKEPNITHTATSNGWVFFYQFNGSDRYFYIDGIQFRLGAGNGGSHYSGNSIFVPVSKGQTFMGNNEIIFFPCINA